MRDKVTNVITTPYGVFTRKSATAYGFAAVAEAASEPEKGLRVVGNRKGDFTVPIVSHGHTYHEPRVRYHTVWSRTAAGAAKNAESYVWSKARLVGVYPVEVK